MIENLAGPGWSLLEKTKWFREAGLDTSTLKLLLLAECRKNLALLGPLKLTDSEIPQDTPIIVAVASRIQYEAIETLLAIDDKSRKAFEQLSQIPFELSGGRGDEQESSAELVGDPKVALGERVLRLYVRMYSIRSFAELTISGESGDFRGCSRIQFRTRLRNIQKVLLILDDLLTKELAAKQSAGRPKFLQRIQSRFLGRS